MGERWRWGEMEMDLIYFMIEHIVRSKLFKETSNHFLPAFLATFLGAAFLGAAFFTDLATARAKSKS